MVEKTVRIRQACYGLVAQFGRAASLQEEGCGFESRLVHLLFGDTFVGRAIDKKAPHIWLLRHRTIRPVGLVVMISDFQSEDAGSIPVRGTRRRSSLGLPARCHLFSFVVASRFDLTAPTLASSSIGGILLSERSGCRFEPCLASLSGIEQWPAR